MSSEDARTVDVDFWPQKATMRELGPYLPAARRAWLRLDEGRPEPLPESQYFVPGDALKRAAGSDDAVPLARARLDELGIERAVVNPGAASSVSGYAHHALAAEVARAVNEWTVATWLEADSRLLGSIVVTPRDTQTAAREIRRAGADRRLVQVLLCYPQELLGHHSLDPIYEAACELDLTIMLEAGGAYSGSNGGLNMIGHPTSIFEALVTWESAAAPHLLNAVMQGVFDRFPQLRLVLSGFGVAWLPALLWRLDFEYRTQRVKPPPSLTRLPSDVVRDHVRLTTSTLEVPADPDQLSQLLASVDGERLLLYGSGPLGGDEGRRFLGQGDPRFARAVLHENAFAHYRLARS